MNFEDDQAESCSDLFEICSEAEPEQIPQDLVDEIS